MYELTKRGVRNGRQIHRGKEDVKKKERKNTECLLLTNNYKQMENKKEGRR